MRKHMLIVPSESHANLPEGHASSRLVRQVRDAMCEGFAKSLGQDVSQSQDSKPRPSFALIDAMHSLCERPRGYGK